MPPSVDRLGTGRSAPTRARNAGVAEPPDDGPAKTMLADWDTSAPVSVPVAVTGLPVTLKIPGNASATLVTVPPEVLLTHVVTPAPSVCSTNPEVPLLGGSWKMVEVPAAAGTRTVEEPEVRPANVSEPPAEPLRPRVGVRLAAHEDAPRVSREPWELPAARSSRLVRVSSLGSPCEAAALPHSVPEAPCPVHWALACVGIKRASAAMINQLRRIVETPTRARIEPEVPVVCADDHRGQSVHR